VIKTLINLSPGISFFVKTAASAPTTVIIIVVLVGVVVVVVAVARLVVVVVVVVVVVIVTTIVIVAAVALSQFLQLMICNKYVYKFCMYNYYHIYPNVRCPYTNTYTECVQLCAWL
jgi:hypothetical protein